jgi:hypothetical protein
VVESGQSTVAVKEISPLNAPPPEAGNELSAAIEDASTSSFHLAMLVGAALCFAGAAVNGVGIRNEKLREEPTEGGPERAMPIPAVCVEPEESGSGA